MLEGLIALTLMAAGLGSFGLVLHLRGEQYQRRREVRRARLWSIGELPEVTIGRIVGITREHETGLTAPLSGKPCLFYQVQAFTTSIGIGGRSRSTMLFEESGGVPFLLDDGADVAVIDPANAVATLAFDDRFGELVANSQERTAFRERNRVNIEVGATLEYHEAVVEPGDTIAVVGFGMRTEGRLRMSSSPRYRLIIADDREGTRHQVPQARIHKRD